MVETNLVDAVLTGCRIYGVSVWDVKLSEGTKQQNLVITDRGELVVTIDDLEIAQFIYLLLRNEKLRRVIDNITSKVVLASRPRERWSSTCCRTNFAGATTYRSSSTSRSRAVGQLMKPSRCLRAWRGFVIADISDAKSVLQELRGFVPNCPTLPVQPIIEAAQEEPGMFDFFRKFPWFLEVQRYDTPVQLLAHLADKVISPLEAEVARLRGLPA